MADKLATVGVNAANATVQYEQQNLLQMLSLHHKYFSLSDKRFASVQQPPSSTGNPTSQIVPTAASGGGGTGDLAFTDIAKIEDKKFPKVIDITKLKTQSLISYANIYSYHGPKQSMQMLSANLNQISGSGKFMPMTAIKSSSPKNTQLYTGGIIKHQNPNNDQLKDGQFFKDIPFSYKLTDNQGKLSEDFLDRQALRIDESKLLPHCGEWSKATIASFSNYLVRLKATEPRFNDYGEDEEDDIVEAEAVMDLSLCKFHAVKIFSKPLNEAHRKDCNSGQISPDRGQKSNLEQQNKGQSAKINEEASHVKKEESECTVKYGFILSKYFKTQFPQSQPQLLATQAASSTLPIVGKDFVNSGGHQQNRRESITNQQPHGIQTQDIIGGNRKSINRHHPGAPTLPSNPQHEVPLYQTQSVIFVCADREEFCEWKRALNSYVVQSVHPQEIYTFSDQLGKGSHAKVFLAEPKFEELVTKNKKKKPAIIQGDRLRANEVSPPEIDISKTASPVEQVTPAILDSGKLSQVGKDSNQKPSLVLNIQSNYQVVGPHPPSDYPKGIEQKLEESKLVAVDGSSHKNATEQKLDDCSPQGRRGLGSSQKSDSSSSCDAAADANVPKAKPQVAIKQLFKEKIHTIENGLEFLMNEIRVHWALEKCVSVVRLLQIFEDEEYIYMVLEYQPNGTLLRTLKSNQQFKEPDVRVIVEQMLLALDFLQRKKVVHRDIKPENILINSIEDNSEYEIRIADFGFAVFTPENEELTHKCGTPGYVAPEMFLKEKYSYKADIFSLGAVFFNLITGRYLFSGENMDQTLRRNVRCDIAGIEKYLSHCSNNCQDLLLKMLKQDPDHRPLAREALAHQWFQQDRNIIRDLLFMNELMCEDGPQRRRDMKYNDVSEDEEEEDEDDDSNISRKIKKLCDDGMSQGISYYGGGQGAGSRKRDPSPYTSKSGLQGTLGHDNKQFSGFFMRGGAQSGNLEMGRDVHSVQRSRHSKKFNMSQKRSGHSISSLGKISYYRAIREARSVQRGSISPNAKKKRVKGNVTGTGAPSGKTNQGVAQSRIGPLSQKSYFQKNQPSAAQNSRNNSNVNRESSNGSKLNPIPARGVSLGPKESINEKVQLANVKNSLRSGGESPQVRGLKGDSLPLNNKGLSPNQSNKLKCPPDDQFTNAIKQESFKIKQQSDNQGSHLSPSSLIKHNKARLQNTIQEDPRNEVSYSNSEEVKFEVRLRRAEDQEQQSSNHKPQIENGSNNDGVPVSVPKITTNMNVADEDMPPEDVDEPSSKAVKSKCNIGLEEEKHCMSQCAAKKRKLLGVQVIEEEDSASPRNAVSVEHEPANDIVYNDLAPLSDQLRSSHIPESFPQLTREALGKIASKYTTQNGIPEKMSMSQRNCRVNWRVFK